MSFAVLTMYEHDKLWGKKVAFTQEQKDQRGSSETRELFLFASTLFNYWVLIRSN